MNCFFDLRNASVASPQQTGATRSEKPGIDYPDTALDRKPLYGEPEDPSASFGDDSGEGFGDERDTKPESIDSPPSRGAIAPGTYFDDVRSADKGKRDRAVSYRPVLRPPMAILSIFDDDMQTADVVRLRGPEFVIGRSSGDFVVPHELLMSGEHAKISRRLENDYHSWYLTDLGSTNGTYLRLKTSKLPHNREFIIGAFRYRFNAAPQGSGRAASQPEQAVEQSNKTLGWQKVNPDENFQAKQSIIRITPQGETREFKFNGTDQIIGCEKDCDIFIGDDETVSSKHARIYMDEHRRWHILDLDSLNGTWLSIKEKKIDMRAHFQIGEQRFCIRFP
ncbi:FHA domain-containing protein [Roseimaritima ulvae]|nr:FHA domain-containing protein [Roseimaritima ulvae]